MRSDETYWRINLVGLNRGGAVAMGIVRRLRGLSIEMHGTSRWRGNGWAVELVRAGFQGRVRSAQDGRSKRMRAGVGGSCPRACIRYRERCVEGRIHARHHVGSCMDWQRGARGITANWPRWQCGQRPGLKLGSRLSMEVPSGSKKYRRVPGNAKVFGERQLPGNSTRHLPPFTLSPRSSFVM